MHRTLIVITLLLAALLACTMTNAPDDENPTVPSTLGVETPIPATGQIQIYLIAQEDNGASGDMIGCGDSIIPVTRDVLLPADPAGKIRAALTDLFSLHDQFYGESGLYNALYQTNLSVESVTIDPATNQATVNLTGEYLLGGVCDNPRFQEQIERTASQFAEVSSVTILIDGTPLDQIVSGEG